MFRRQKDRKPYTEVGDRAIRSPPEPPYVSLHRARGPEYEGSHLGLKETQRVFRGE